MSRSFLFALLAVVFAAPLAAPALADDPAPLEGLWALPDNHIQIRIKSCGDTVCGELVAADKLKDNPELKDKMNENPALRDRPVRGLLVLTDFTGGPTQWEGEVYDPDEGRTYHSSMTLADDDTLKVKGCIIKPLCKSKTLTRVR